MYNKESKEFIQEPLNYEPTGRVADDAPTITPQYVRELIEKSEGKYEDI